MHCYTYPKSLTTVCFLPQEGVARGSAALKKAPPLVFENSSPAPCNSLQLHCVDVDL